MPVKKTLEKHQVVTNKTIINHTGSSSWMTFTSVMSCLVGSLYFNAYPRKLLISGPKKNTIFWAVWRDYPDKEQNYIKGKLIKKYNCTGPPTFNCHRVGYQSSQRLLHHYQTISIYKISLIYKFILKQSRF